MKMAVLAFAATIAEAAVANDSEAAVGVGGLTLIESKDISLDHEDLYISVEEVRVRYRFTNHSKRDIEALIAFPLPPAAEEYDGGVDRFPAERLEFKTAVNGTPVKYDIVDVPTMDGRNVSELLKKHGWDVNLGSDPEDHRFFDKLSAAEIDAAVKDGLVKRDAGSIMPLWSVQTHITRKQIFPAGKTVSVFHQYKPMIGGSVGGGLSASTRNMEDGSGHYYLDDYCTDQDFLTSFDRKYSQIRKTYPDSIGYTETWLSYILSSGSNWKGPIKDFRLVVDKGEADKLVSFCMDGVKKISPTQFEVRKKNFEPKRDLNILIVNWHRPVSDK